MNVSASQARFNEETRERWEHYRSHREKLDNLLAAIAGQWFGRLGSLAILGAGNGNDLELARLANRFEKIHLFDFDSQALERLTKRHLHDPKVRQAVVLERPVDLSGIADDLNGIDKDSITEAAVLELAERARDPQMVLRERSFDVVISGCMLTQLLAGVLESFGDDSSHKDYMMLALRDGHLKLMSRLVKPGGHGLLVSDFVSSDTLPELKDADTDEAVVALARKAIEQRNFFTGTNPWAIKDSLANMIVEDANATWTISPPWRWQIGDSRFYLVTALQFTKPKA